MTNPFNAEQRARDRTRETQQSNGGQTQAGAPVDIRSFYWTLEDIANLKPPSWIIEGLIPRSAKVLIFGESGSYKSIHAVDMFCHAAYGMNYHGLEVAICPVCFIANEDAYGLAVHHVQGWHQHYGKPPGRLIVIPGNVKLDTPEDVEKTLAAARHAFGEERPMFVVDTWDRSMNGDQNQTTDVNPALSGLDALIAAGAGTTTISHSPWPDKDRTKGSVTFWANHDTRLKTEKDKTTGQGSLRIIHQKHAQSGLTLTFNLEQFEFNTKAGVIASTLIPQRIDNPPPNVTTRTLGSNQKIVLDALRAAIADDPRDPPPAPDIPRNSKGSTPEQWETAALRYLTRDEPKYRKRAFDRAKAALVAAKTVHQVEEFVWIS